MLMYYNSPDRYMPPNPSGEGHVIPPMGGMSTAPKLRNGLYYRGDIPMDASALAAELTEGGGTITTHQYWAEMGWKTAHGTYDSVQRFGLKIQEESGELVEAIVDYRRNRTAAARDHVIEEMGDLGFCATALACNAGASIDSNLKYMLYQYTTGILWFDHTGQPVEPTWRSQAAALATKYTAITMQDIDGLMEAGFVPLPTTVMNVHDPEDGEDGPHLSDWLHELDLHVMTLEGRSHEQYAWGGAHDTLERSHMVLSPAFEAMGWHIGNVVAKFCLDTAYVARAELDSSLSEVVRANIAKVMHRIATNRIDKSDGPR